MLYITDLKEISNISKGDSLLSIKVEYSAFTIKNSDNESSQKKTECNYSENQ